MGLLTPSPKLFLLSGMPLSCKWNYRVKKRLFQNRGPEGALRETGAGDGDVKGQAEDGLG